MNEQLIVKSAKVVKSSQPDVYTIWASTQQLDSQGDIIEYNAFKNLKDYLKRYPRILYDHSWVNMMATGEETLPIGKAVSGRAVRGEGLQLDFKFSPLPLAQQIKTLVDNDFPMFASVGGFIKEFLEEKQDDESIIRRIKNFYLVETSLTAIPANEGAEFIKNLKAAGMATNKITQAIEEVVNYGTRRNNAGMSGKNKYLSLANTYLNKR